MKNYESTENPEIYKGVYWGNFKYNEEDKEIIENRNRFIKDRVITKAVCSLKVPKYVLHQSNIYLFEKTLDGEYTNSWSRKEFADHSEFYKTKTGYAVITSPCSDMYEEEAKSYGYERIQPLYNKEFPTYIKTKFIANRKSAKQYYLEEFGNQKENS